MAWTNGNKRTSTTQWKALRRRAKTQLDHRCQHCGDENSPLELDHILNHARGGTDDLSNLQWLCRPCHNIKTQREAAERRGRYRRREAPPLGKGKPTPP
ncbi:HNH endonuclease [Corynebacterium variabile]|uniref:HNH endonuclease n=1 Tax=Corynebacterium variabile TaxID=1727 RepID=UPI0035E3EB36